MGKLKKYKKISSFKNEQWSFSKVSPRNTRLNQRQPLIFSFYFVHLEDVHAIKQFAFQKRIFQLREFLLEQRDALLERLFARDTTPCSLHSFVFLKKF